jgi:glycosyltransferase involved in cell wall biosynthesis
VGLPLVIEIFGFKFRADYASYLALSLGTASVLLATEPILGMLFLTTVLFMPNAEVCVRLIQRIATQQNRFGRLAQFKVHKFGYGKLRRVLEWIYPRFNELSSSEFGVNFPKVLIVPKSISLESPLPKFMPSVSVIMPFHNRKEFLGEAIASALASEGVKIELILVDDASDDGASEIAQELSQRNDAVTYIRVPHPLGAYVARNFGISAASGEYLAFLDSDDVHDPKRLIRQIQVLQIYPKIKVALTGGQRFLRNFNGVLLSQDRYASISMVFHKSLVKSQGYFDSVKVGGDREFLYRTLRNFPAPAIAIIPFPFYHIRLSEGSLTTSGFASFYPRGDLDSQESLPTVRKQYRKAYWDAHKQNGHFFVPWPQTQRVIPLGDSENIVVMPTLER